MAPRSLPTVPLALLFYLLSLALFGCALSREPQFTGTRHLRYASLDKSPRLVSSAPALACSLTDDEAWLTDDEAEVHGKRQSAHLSKRGDLDVVEDKIIYVLLFHRGGGYDVSLSDAKAAGDHKWFHWALGVTPENGGRSAAFDQSNAISVQKGFKGNVVDNPVQPGGKQPKFEFQYKYDVNPINAPTLAGRVQIGKTSASVLEIQGILEKVPTPCGEESCVDWAKAAVKKLQEVGKVPKFDVDDFSKKTLAFGFQNFEGNIDRLKAVAEYTPTGVLREKVVKDLPLDTKPMGPSELPDKGGTEGKFTPVTCKRDGTNCDVSLNDKLDSDRRKGPPGPDNTVSVSTRQRAAKSFRALMAEKGLTSVLGRGVTFYKLERGLANFKIKAVGFNPHGVIGFGAWAAGVIQAFTTESTALQRAAAVTSLMPVAGCGVGLGADLEKGRRKAVAVIDFGLCVASDVLSLIPGAQIASLILEAVRLVIAFLEGIFALHYSEPVPLETMHEQYVNGWTSLSRQMTKTLESRSMLRNITERIQIEKTDVVFMASQVAALLEAETISEAASADNQSPTSLRGSKDPFFQTETDKAMSNRTERLRQEFKTSMVAQLEDAYGRFDDDFNLQLREWLYKIFSHPSFLTSMFTVNSYELATQRTNHYMRDFQRKYRRWSGRGLSPGPDTKALEEVIDDSFNVAGLIDTHVRYWAQGAENKCKEHCVATAVVDDRWRGEHGLFCVDQCDVVRKSSRDHRIDQHVRYWTKNLDFEECKERGCVDWPADQISMCEAGCDAAKNIVSHVREWTEREDLDGCARDCDSLAGDAQPPGQWRWRSEQAPFCREQCEDMRESPRRVQEAIDYATAKKCPRRNPATKGVSSS